MKQRHLNFLALACVFLISGGTAAEGEKLEKWPIEKILMRASERTPEVKALRKDIERAENLARQAGRWDNPEGAIAYGPMSQGAASGRSLDLSLKQNIPLFGQKSIAERLGEQNKATVEAESKKQDLILGHAVGRLAYCLASLEEQAQHVAHRKDRINLIAKFLETRPFASPAQAVEKSLVLNRLREIEERFLEISSARESAWRGLNVFLDLDSKIVPQAHWRKNAVLPDRRRFLSLFQAQNPDFARQESLIASASLGAEQAAKKGFPEIRLGGSYNEQSAGTLQRVYSGTIEFSLPILDRGGYAKQAAFAEKEAALYRLEQKRRELSFQFEQAWNRLETHQGRIHLFPLTLVEDLESQMNRTEQNWKRGLVPVTAFLDLENQVHDQASKVFDAQTGYADALSELELLAGLPFGAGSR